MAGAVGRSDNRRSAAAVLAIELFPQPAVLGLQLGGPSAAPHRDEQDDDHGDEPAAQDGQEQEFLGTESKHG